MIYKNKRKKTMSDGKLQDYRCGCGNFIKRNVKEQKNMQIKPSKIRVISHSRSYDNINTIKDTNGIVKLKNEQLLHNVM